MRLLTALVAVAVVATGAMAQQGKEKGIWTGGAKGAYHGTFCPPLEPVLRQAQFTGYNCTSCEPGKPCGSVANIERVLANPASIGFSQLDVYARAAQEKPEIAEKTQVVKQLACEGIWAITNNPSIENFGDALGLARRLPFKVAAGGSTATFEYMKSLDPDGLGRARNVQTLPDASAVIDAIKNDKDAVGIFVQFADPTNLNIAKMMESGMRVLPVSSRPLLRAKVGDQIVYKVQSFPLAGGWSAKEMVTACTPVVIITGKATAFTDKDDQADQADLIKTVQKLPDDKLLPQEGRIAALMRAARSLSDSALEQMNSAIEAAQKKMERTN